MAASGARIASQMIASSSSSKPASASSKPYGRHRCAHVNVDTPRTLLMQRHQVVNRSAPRARQITVTSRAAASAASASSGDEASRGTRLRMIVLRHSDSCTEDASLKDHDRPLTTWGRTLAAQLCRNLVEAGWADPDVVLCSASTRSRETLNELTKVHAPISAAETHFLGSLYHFAAMDGVTADHLRETIVAKTKTTTTRVNTLTTTSDEKAADKAADNRSDGKREVRTVMCIGHNKGWEEAASDFAGTEVKLEVANAALLECDIPDVTTWEEAFALDSVSAAKERLKGGKEEASAQSQSQSRESPRSSSKKVGWRVVAVVKHGVEPQEPPPADPPMPSFGRGGPTPMPSV